MESFKYGNEPMDLKLLALLFCKKIWLWIAITVIGGVVFGGVYFLKNVTFAKEASYQTNTDYYFSFAEESPGVDYVYYNESTWNNLIYTDEFIETALGYMTTDVSKEFLKTAITKEPMNDVRMLTILVTTQDPALSLEIAGAMEKSFIDYCSSHVEFTNLEILTPALIAEKVLFTPKTGNAILAGCVLANFLFFLFGMITIILDDAIYLQKNFERRYNIPVFGTLPLFKEEKDKTEFVKTQEWERLFENLIFITKDKQNLGLLDIAVGDGAKDLHQMLTINQEKNNRFGKQYSMKPPLLQNTMVYEHIRSLDGVILMISYGKHYGKQIDLTISQLEKQQCDILGAVLMNADEKLTRAYYRDWFSAIGKSLFKKKQN